MSNVGTVEVIASIDTSKYKAGAKDIDKSNRDISDSTDKSSKESSNAWDRMAGAAKIAATAVVASSAAIGAGLFKAVNAYASLEQSLGGSEVVFEKYSSKVQKLAMESAGVMGTSVNQYLETANKMGSLFQGAGFSVERSMELSSMAMQRATDVATAMGISTEMALESVAGAAKGNFTMMDNLGVAMNDTTLEAYRLEKGLGTAVSKMTSSQKVGLAMEMFLDRTAKLAGNYARENDTLAGSFTTLRARWENFMAGTEGSGEELGKAFAGVARVLGRELPGIVGRLGDGFSGLYNELRRSSPEFARTADTIIEVSNAARNVARFLWDLRPIIVGVTAAWVGYRVAIIASNAVFAAQSALMALAGTRMLVYNGAVIAVRNAVTLATIAQGAWNAVLLLNPIGLVVGAALALVAVLATVMGTTNKTTDSTERLNNARRIQKEMADRAKQAEDELAGAQLGADRAALSLESAQKRLNEAVAKYGPESYEARDAALAVKEANRQLESANKDLNTSFQNVNTNVDNTREALRRLDGTTATVSVVGDVTAWKQNGQKFFGGGFATGGFTGRGGTNEPAGTVHRGEYVLPKRMVNQSTGLPDLDRLVGSQGSSSNQSITINLSGTFATSKQEQRNVAELIATRLKEAQSSRAISGGAI